MFKKFIATAKFVFESTIFELQNIDFSYLVSKPKFAYVSEIGRTAKPFSKVIVHSHTWRNH